MKIKVEYSESIQVAEGLWRKIGIEVESDSIENDPNKLHEVAKGHVQRWHRDSLIWGAPIKGETIEFSGEQKIESPKQSATERMLSSINSCTEVKTLESFKLLVRNNADFKAAYNKKMEELSK